MSYTKQSNKQRKAESRGRFKIVPGTGPQPMHFIDKLEKRVVEWPLRRLKREFNRLLRTGKTLDKAAEAGGNIVLEDVKSLQLSTYLALGCVADEFKRRKIAVKQ